MKIENEEPSILELYSNLKLDQSMYTHTGAQKVHLFLIKGPKLIIKNGQAGA